MHICVYVVLCVCVCVCVCARIHMYVHMYKCLSYVQVTVNTVGSKVI